MRVFFMTFFFLRVVSLYLHYITSGMRANLLKANMPYSE